MKTKLLFLTLPALLFGAQPVQPDLKWVDNEIEAIKPPRKGIAPYKIAGLKNPFAHQLALNQPPLEKTEEMPQIQAAPEIFHPLTLQAVFNEDTALIDGKWYKKDEKIYGYVIQEIGFDAVWLSKKKKKLKLSLFKQNDNIKINAK